MEEQQRRRIGRPPREEVSEDTARVEVRMPPELRQQVRVAAALADVGMGEWIKRAISGQLARERQAAAEQPAREEA